MRPFNRTNRSDHSDFVGPVAYHHAVSRYFPPLLDASRRHPHSKGVSTLAEIEEVVPQLSVEELAELERFVRKVRQKQNRQNPHSVLDLKPVYLGEMLRPLGDSRGVV